MHMLYILLALQCGESKIAHDVLADFVDEYEDIDYGVDASDQNFGEQLFDKLEAAGFAPDDPDLPTVDASQDATTMDTMQNFEYPEYDDSQDYDPFENFRDYGSID